MASKLDKNIKTTNFALGIMLRRLISLVDIDFKSARLRSQCLRLRKKTDKIKEY